MCFYLKWKISIWVDSALSKRQRRSNKITNTRHENASFELLVRVSQETPEPLLVIVLGFPPRGRKEVTPTENITCFRHLSQRSLGQNRFESLLPEDELSWYPMANYRLKQWSHGTMKGCGSGLPRLIVTKSSLIRFKTWLTRGDITLGTENLVIYPGLVESGVLEKNLLSPLYETSRIHIYILNTCPYTSR